MFLDKLLEKQEPLIICIILAGFSNLAVPFFIARSLRLFSYMAILFILIKKRNHIFYILSKDRIIVLLHVLALVSVIWSFSPYITVTRFIALVRTTLVGVILAAYTPQEQARLFSYIFVGSGFFSLLAVGLFPNYALESETSGWNGVFLFKNHLGMMMAFGASLFLSKLLFLRQRSILLPLVFLGALVLLIFSQSSTSIVVFFSSLLLVPIYVAIKQGYKVRALYFVLTILGIIAFSLIISSNLSFLVEDVLGKDLSLTGRDNLWREIIIQGQKRPLLGYGYRAFWYTKASLEAAANNAWPPLPPPGQFLEDFHSHNGYVEMFVMLGFTGLGLLIASCVTVFSRLFKYLTLAANVEALWMLQILLMIVIANYTEAPSLLASNNLQWILYVTVSFSSAIQLERLKNERLGKTNYYPITTKVSNPYLVKGKYTP